MAKRRTTDIPMHQMETENGLGLWVENTKSMRQKKKDDRVMQAHSDDHYIFFLLTRGALDFMVDFEKIRLEGQMLGFILPGQVHHYAEGDFDIGGWFVAVDTALVDARFRAVFEDKMLSSQLVKLAETKAMEQCLALVKQYIPQAGEKHVLPVIHHLIGAFLGMAACHFSPDQSIPQRYSGRAAEITSGFRMLVSQHYMKQMKPSDYAALLNISATYLNEVVQYQTGATSTYWIQQETMLAAKRLLYHTDLTVKEVAYQVGFADHAYFSRLFRKRVRQTPLEFRGRYRESSNIVL